MATRQRLEAGRFDADRKAADAGLAPVMGKVILLPGTIRTPARAVRSASAMR